MIKNTHTPKRTKGIELMRRPVKATYLQVSGMRTYRYSFIPKLSQQTAPFREMLKKNAEFGWTSVHDAIFKHMNTLSYFRPDIESIVQVYYASSRGLSGAIVQVGKQTAFTSKTQ